MNKEIGKHIHESFDQNPTYAKLDLMAKARKNLPALDEKARKSLDEIRRSGMCILEGVLSPEEVEEIRLETLRIMDAEALVGRNNFEGRKTRRPYSILSKSRVYDRLVAHPRIIELLDHLLLPNYLLTTSQAIEILPEETPQPLHFDDSFCLVPRPRQYFSVAIMAAITDFTKENGATVMYPGSHVWGKELPDPKDGIPCEMKAGSVAIFLGTLWHGGGRNETDKGRIGVTFQYCEPYIRTQENFFLSHPPELVANLSPKIQSLLGYSIHPPFIGQGESPLQVTGRHPLKWLDKNFGIQSKSKL